jgi:branched-chain amino acid transport system permease protein
MAGIYCILAMGQNLVTGFAGQLSLGQVAFYGLGGYSAALLAIHYGLPFYVTFVAGALVAAVFGLVVGVPALRLGGIYLGIATLGFAEIVRLVFLNWVRLTRGPMGLPGIPAPRIFGYTFSRAEAHYLLILALCLGVYLVLRRLVESRTGLALLALREDEVAAASVGVSTSHYKILAFTVAAFISGLAGAFYAHFITFVSPASFTRGESFLILSMYALGGPGSLEGSLLGAVLLSLAPELLRSASSYRMVLYGLLLVLLIIYKPGGLAGMLQLRRPAAGWDRRRPGRAAE